MYMTINESVIKDIIEEELTRSDVNSIISDKMSSQEFKKKVKELASEVVNELLRFFGRGIHCGNHQ